MTRYDYDVARHLAADDPPFEALLMAAILRASPPNVDRIAAMFPAIANEARARWHAPAGVLASDDDAIDALARGYDPSAWAADVVLRPDERDRRRRASRRDAADRLGLPDPTTTEEAATDA